MPKCPNCLIACVNRDVYTQVAFSPIPCGRWLLVIPRDGRYEVVTPGLWEGAILHEEDIW